MLCYARSNTSQHVPVLKKASKAITPPRHPERGAVNNITPLSAKFKRWTRRSQQTRPQTLTEGESATVTTKARQQQRLPRHTSTGNLHHKTAHFDKPIGPLVGKHASTQKPGKFKPKQAGARYEDIPFSQRTSLVENSSENSTVVSAFQQLWRPLFLVFASAHVLATVCAVTDVASSPPWMPPTVGAAVGILFAVLNRYGVVRWWRAPAAPLRVVITGSSKGIGKALAREFCRAGDHVIVTARSRHSVRKTVAELRAEMGPSIRITGTEVDVGNPASVARLAKAAPLYFGGAVDVWINNAGFSGSFQPLVESSAAQVQEVVCTNLLGTLLATRAAILTMESQSTAGHIFNVDGAGADGAPTPNYAAYGATKSGIAHLMGSLSAELKDSGSTTAVHTVSPGMVLTGLLLSGATPANKRAFNILCEQPETIAAYLAPRMRTVVARDGRQQYIRYLTPGRALWFLLMAPLRIRRYFDDEGRQLYGDEWSRLFGPLRKRTERLTAAAARRTSSLGLAYSLSMTVAFLLIASAAVVETAASPLPPLL